MKLQEELQKEAKAAVGDAKKMAELTPLVQKVNAKVATTNKELRGIGEAAKTAQQSSANWIDSMMNASPLAGMYNALKGSITGVKSGFETAGSGAKSFRTALIAIPIMAIITAITALVQWFRRTEKGAQTLRVITAATGQVFQTLMDVVSKLGETLFNAFSNP
ncbi:MAG: hypothetical protein HC831_26410, partial [Chloroflexia bacterium]|nr:hypothetical protein [Chloroflexia bacterium]